MSNPFLRWALMLVCLVPATLASVNDLAVLPNNASATCIQVDADGNIYVVGSFVPANPKSSSDTSDGFVAKLSRDGSKVLFWTTLGGSGDDRVNAIALGQDGGVYVTGFSRSPDFPLTHGAAQSANGLVFAVRLVWCPS